LYLLKKLPILVSFTLISSFVAFRINVSHLYSVANWLIVRCALYCYEQLSDCILQAKQMMVR
jgi:hypothetical protein